VPFFFGLFGGSAGQAPNDPGAIKDMIENKLSFIGVSAYAPGTGPGFPTNELENAAFNVKVGAGEGAVGRGRLAWWRPAPSAGRLGRQRAWRDGPKLT
jgi:hypothetical protein